VVVGGDCGDRTHSLVCLSVRRFVVQMLFSCDELEERRLLSSETVFFSLLQKSEVNSYGDEQRYCMQLLT
jgi:hypothetical protein